MRVDLRCRAHCFEPNRANKLRIGLTVPKIRLPNKGLLLSPSLLRCLFPSCSGQSCSSASSSRPTAAPARLQSKGNSAAVISLSLLPLSAGVRASRRVADESSSDSFRSFKPGRNTDLDGQPGGQ
ncbi:unnamed protein product [Cuscuta campestris]|uniref:Uncharacterized protein n=1 Tax=Cuscuta campestris TaxID=132261 RepID=A0A484LNG0_9ASTE|nr:unnamed protein product [Cuscuta campestris]